MLLEGEMALKADGKEEVFKAGDSFVIPAGWKGTWECEPGSWEHNNKVDEYVMLLEGEMALKADGTEEVFKAGDSFVIPAGWKGIWEVRVPMKKYFVKHAPAA